MKARTKPIYYGGGSLTGKHDSASSQRKQVEIVRPHHQRLHVWRGFSVICLYLIATVSFFVQPTLGYCLRG
jgi:hypothetical protein